MNPIRLPLLLLIGLVLAAQARAEDPPKTGQFNETFKDRSPMSDMKVLGERLGIGAAGLVDYDLASEAFTVYVPAAYKPDDGYGVIVFMNQADDGNPYPGWTQVFDKHKFIWVCPNKATIRAEKDIGRSLGLMLDAAANITAKYKVDPARVYISGIAGASGSSILGPSFPDVFTGGGLYMQGSRFYKAAKGPGEDGLAIQPAFRPPSDALLKVAKNERCYVLITGEKSPQFAPVDRAVFEGYKAEGFKAVDLLEIPGAANVIPDASWLEKCLVKLDDLRKGIKDLPPVATNPADPKTPATPNTPAPPAAPAVEVKKGAFTATFDKRSQFSPPSVMSRVVASVSRTEKDYDISKESFHVYVPQEYEPGKPYGILVSLLSEVALTDQQLSGLWKNALDKKHLIYVGIKDLKPEAGDHKRIGLALDAVENIRQRYTTDEDRVYLIGISRASPHVGKAALHFPNVFNGAIFLQGVTFYRDITEGQTRYLGGMQPPSNAQLKDAKANSRFCFVGPGSGQNYTAMNLMVTKGWQADGFSNARMLKVDKLDNQIPGVQSVGLAIDDVDKPLARSDAKLMAEANRAEKQKKLGEALYLYEKAALRSSDDKRKADAESKAAALREQHAKGMAEVRKLLAAKDEAGAKSALEKLDKEFGELPTNEAGTLLATLGGPTKGTGPGGRNPPDKAGPPAAGAELVAKNRLEAARKLMTTNLAAGYKELRDIAERLGTTAAGKEALAEAEKTWADPEKRKLIEAQTLEAEATRLYVLAKRYVDTGDLANAREKLNQIMEDYPDSKISSDAAALLVEIKDK